MAEPTPPWRALLTALSEIPVPVWGIRLVGILAIGLAFTIPTLAGLGGWVVYGGAVSDQPENLRPRLVWLPGGTFMMGSPEGVGDSDEHPQHEVTLTRFGICETEVTVRQYELVTGEKPSDCYYGCDDDHPVQTVSWEDSARYLNALTRLENRTRPEDPLTECYDEQTWAWDRRCTGYRLPTEAEWEYAARAGSTTAFHFGDDKHEICQYGNINDAQVNCTDNYSILAPVGSFKANAWGLYDMHGNVWEWTYDWYDSSFYEKSQSKDENPANKNTASDRTLRGGSFDFLPSFARSAVRFRFTPVFRYWIVGLRCVRGPSPQH